MIMSLLFISLTQNTDNLVGDSLLSHISRQEMKEKDICLFLNEYKDDLHESPFLSSFSFFLSWDLI